jgi:hypothetical protein
MCNLCIFKRIVFMVLVQHLLMVSTSSSKSNHSQAEATHGPLKIGPPAKKAVIVLMAKAKKDREQSVKKRVGGKCFFYQVVMHLMLTLNR